MTRQYAQGITLRTRETRQNGPSHVFGSQRRMYIHVVECHCDLPWSPRQGSGVVLSRPVWLINSIGLAGLRHPQPHLRRWRFIESGTPGRQIRHGTL